MCCRQHRTRHWRVERFQRSTPASFTWGALCPKGHGFHGTGQSLRRQHNMSCRECENTAKREKRAREKAERRRATGRQTDACFGPHTLPQEPRSCVQALQGEPAMLRGLLWACERQNRHGGVTAVGVMAPRRPLCKLRCTAAWVPSSWVRLQVHRWLLGEDHLRDCSALVPDRRTDGVDVQVPGGKRPPGAEMDRGNGVLTVGIVVLLNAVYRVFVMLGIPLG